MGLHNQRPLWPRIRFGDSRIVSLCSTVARNTVVRVTIKVNGKLQILVTHSPQAPESVDLKFDLDDVGGLEFQMCGHFGPSAYRSCDTEHAQ